MKKPVLLAAGLLAPLLALAIEPLNVKTGKWEITTITETSGMPNLPPEVLAIVPEAQREQMAALLSEKPKTTKSEECVTQDELDKPFDPQDMDNCTATAITSTSTRQEYIITCTGERPGKGMMRIDATTPESFTGMFEVAIGNGDTPMQIKADLAGRWVGAVCKDEDSE